jgi:hypothetical protein
LSLHKHWHLYTLEVFIGSEPSENDVIMQEKEKRQAFAEEFTAGVRTAEARDNHRPYRSAPPRRDGTESRPGFNGGVDRANGPS